MKKHAHSLLWKLSFLKHYFGRLVANFTWQVVVIMLYEIMKFVFNIIRNEEPLVGSNKVQITELVF